MTCLMHYVSHRVLGVHSIILIFCLAIWCMPVHAETCPNEAYSVTGIAIDSSAVTGTKAREIGIADATEMAFAKVIDRMIVPDKDARALMQSLPADSFVDFFHITSENALAQRYIAEIDICFDAARVRGALMSANLQWAELFSPPVLLLPIWQEPAGVRVWTRDILWLNRWQDFSKTTDKLVRFTILEPDLALERSLPARPLLMRDKDMLAKAAKAAGAVQIVWLYAGLDYRKSLPELTMLAELYDADGGMLAVVGQEQRPLDGQTNLHVAFDAFQEDVMNVIEQSWRSSNFYVVDNRDEILISVDISSLTEWYDIRRRLAEIAGIADLSVISLTAKKGSLRAQLSGSVEAVQLGLQEQGYELVSGSAAGHYALRLETN